MSKYYLRVEGVNLNGIFSDSQQISVIRGGSLLLRNAIKIIAKNFSQLKRISSGASVGLFEFTALDETAATMLCQAVADHLSTDASLQYLTFVVDVQPVSNDFSFDKEAVLARNRFRQMQQLSLAMPEENHSMAMGPCEVDNLRPASKTVLLQEENKHVSQSIDKRLTYGRRQKRQFYRDETKKKLNFTQDFQELAHDEEANPLNHKIAVLYLDGNQFNKIQTQYGQTIDAMREFDTNIQEKRRAFLSSLLDKIKEDPTFLTTENKLRLETLLWGGDEMIFVVPAWKGLEVLNFFYTYSQEWTFRKARLTHAGGIVFCQAHAPIHRMRKLAEELAKEVKNSPGGREQNLFDYLVLESIDFPTESIKRLRQRQFGNFLSRTRQPLTPFPYDLALKSVKLLKEKVPKSQAYAAVQNILHAPQGEQETKTQQEAKAQFDRLIQVTGHPLESLTADLERVFPRHPQDWQWIHWIELWDYWT